MTGESVALAFVKAINSKQTAKLSSLMAENHRFINSDGGESRGRARMSDAWRRYFEMVPDYRIDVHEVFSRGDSVVLLGTAEGTFAEQGALDPRNHWLVPAAWKVVVENERVAVWQLYVDTEPMRAVMDRMERADQR